MLICVGVACASFGLKSFLLPAHFIDGGMTGISLLFDEVVGWPPSLLLLVINIPFILLAIKVINKTFALKAAAAITVLAICLYFVSFPSVTQDKLLVSVFGGFFIGAGIWLSVRGGAVLDGTEILAIFLGKKFHTTIGDFTILFNVIISLFAAYLLSVEQALYSIITYFAASKTP